MLYCTYKSLNTHKGTWVIPPGWGTICDGVNCYILINIVVISYCRWRDWFHSNLKPYLRPVPTKPGQSRQKYFLVFKYFQGVLRVLITQSHPQWVIPNCTTHTGDGTRIYKHSKNTQTPSCISGDFVLVLWEQVSFILIVYISFY